MNSYNNGTPPDNISLLIFEESLGVARSLGELLETYGFRIAGLATCKTTASKLVSEREFDVSVITVGRMREEAITLAEEILRQGRKIVFLTGYGDVEELPARLAKHPRLDKPADPRQLASTILSVLGYAWGS